MILVKREKDETTQKVVNTFMKRAKKANIVARARKTQVNPEIPSHLAKKKKKLKQVKYLEKAERNKVSKL